MSEASLLTTLLEKLLTFQQEHTNTMLLVVEANAALAQVISDNTQRLEQSIAAHLQRLDDSMAAHAQQMAHIVERIVHTTDRTEQMTQRLLMQFTPPQ